MKPIGLTLCLSVNICKGGPSQVMEQMDDGQGVGDDQKMMIKIQLEKKKERNKNGLKEKV
jgi:hypothetical protein